MRRVIALLFALALLLFPLPARAEACDEAAIFELYGPQGQLLTMVGRRIYEGDEYIAADNRLYRVERVDEGASAAYARLVGEEPPVDGALAAMTPVLAQAEEPKGGKKLICLYSTHSDESYVPTDGDSSLTHGAGIYDVDEALKAALEEKGIEVVLDKSSSLPHDSEAYGRSRRIAEELMKKSPAALLDVHRDGIPDESEYEIEMKGQDASRVRLLVGRSNPNASANREFAKRIKAAADRMYPGLIKDIFIGKGNYNQELYPQALLLEFGTHTLDKERAIESTAFMADVLDSVLFGSGANASAAAQNKAAGSGAIWLIVLLGAGAMVYALASTGSLKAAAGRVARSAEEFAARRRDGR